MINQDEPTSSQADEFAQGRLDSMTFPELLNALADYGFDYDRIPTRDQAEDILFYIYREEFYS